MNADVTDYLHDVLDAISKIKFHIQHVTSVTDFLNNITITDAVERRLAIIGEAIWKATKINQSLQISEYKKIISLRHLIVHDYDIVDQGTLWRIIHTDLPLLQIEVEQILNKLEE